MKEDREALGGRDICIIRADLHCCMAQTNQHCKKKNFLRVKRKRQKKSRDAYPERKGVGVPSSEEKPSKEVVTSFI